MTPAEVRAARKALGMSRRQLAEAIGYSVHAVESIELERRPIERRFELAVQRLLERKGRGCD